MNSGNVRQAGSIWSKTQLSILCGLLTYLAMSAETERIQSLEAIPSVSQFRVDYTQSYCFARTFDYAGIVGEPSNLSKAQSFFNACDSRITEAFDEMERPTERNVGYRMLKYFCMRDYEKSLPIWERSFEEVRLLGEEPEGEKWNSHVEKAEVHLRNTFQVFYFLCNYGNSLLDELEPKLVPRKLKLPNHLKSGVSDFPVNQVPVEHIKGSEILKYSGEVFDYHHIPRGQNRAQQSRAFRAFYDSLKAQAALGTVRVHYGGKVVKITFGCCDGPDRYSNVDLGEILKANLGDYYIVYNINNPTLHISHNLNQLKFNRDLISNHIGDGVWQGIYLYLLGIERGWTKQFF